MNDYNRKTHVEHCRNKVRTTNLGSNSNRNKKNEKQSDKLKKSAASKSRNSDSNGTRRCSQRLKRKLDDKEEASSESEDTQNVTNNSVVSDEEEQAPQNESIEIDSYSQDEEEEYMEQQHSPKSKKAEASHDEPKCCEGYRPPVTFPSGETIYSNFPFQALDNDRENIKFVIVNGVFHNQSCFKKDYKLQKDSRNGMNRLCSDLAYHKCLQNILKRGQIMTNFSSIPHQYLTYNQLKMELNHYRDSIKKLKLDNLNLKRTIDSLRGKDESYRKFIGMLANNDYAKLSQLIMVCLNQKKGINGIIEKLLDSTDGSYHPREKELLLLSAVDQPQATIEEVECRLCSELVSLAKMRDHVTQHLQKREVEEHANRCGFCGQTDACSISVRIAKDSNKQQQRQAEPSSWPESNCPYFRNFNLKLLIRQEKTGSGVCINRPVECAECSTCLWSLNLNAHYREQHPGVELPLVFGGQFTSPQHQQLGGSGAASFRSDEAPCKICNELCSLSKMRDHVARHILLKDVEASSSLCGFCGRNDSGCTLAIVITSGKGKNTTYGPASSCPYFRKFNLKSSAKPTKSSPSTNRPIECHICKLVCWSYNVRCHFAEAHGVEDHPPELITAFERELIYRS